MRSSVILSALALLVACSSPQSAPTLPTVVATADVIEGQTPTPLSAEFVGNCAHGLKLVRIVFTDNATGEELTTAQFRDAANNPLMTQNASALGYGEGTGTRTIELCALKDATQVQLAARWPADNDPNTATDHTPYSGLISITK